MLSSARWHRSAPKSPRSAGDPAISLDTLGYGRGQLAVSLRVLAAGHVAKSREPNQHLIATAEPADLRDEDQEEGAEWALQAGPPSRNGTGTASIWAM